MQAASISAASRRGAACRPETGLDVSRAEVPLTRTRRVIVLLVLGAAAAAVAVRFPVAEWAVTFVAWVRSAGVPGALVFAAVYIAATVMMLPGSLLTLGAGLAYGPVVGTALVSPVSVVAATCAFLLGRTTAREWVARRIARAPRFAAVDRAVGREGFRIVLLLRLSPLVPFTLLNYALGLTRVRLRDFAIASWVGMLPGTVLYVYLGSLLTSATELAAGVARPESSASRLLYWGGLAATVAAAWLVTKTARRALDRSLREADPALALDAEAGP